MDTFFLAAAFTFDTMENRDKAFEFFILKYKKLGSDFYEITIKDIVDNICPGDKEKWFFDSDEKRSGRKPNPFKEAGNVSGFLYSFPFSDFCTFNKFVENEYWLAVNKQN
jgi:hypothetical protein